MQLFNLNSPQNEHVNLVQLEIQSYTTAPTEYVITLRNSMQPAAQGTIYSCIKCYTQTDGHANFLQRDK